MGNFEGSWGFASAALGLLACVLWWIVRQQKKRIWFPVLRVIQIDKKVVPQLRWVYPPWVAFLAFLVGAIALTIFSFMPFNLIPKDEKTDLQRVHVLFDLSPSVKHNLKIEKYREEAYKILESLGQEHKLTFSTTESSEIFDYGEEEKAVAKIRSLEFHSAGSKLGSTVEKILNRQSLINRLIIVSDRDQASWSDFNWRYVGKQIDVSRLDLSMIQSESTNVFIDDARFKEKAQNMNQSQTWIVVLRRLRTNLSLSGSIQAWIRDKKIASKDWSFAANDSSLEMEISLDLTAYPPDEVGPVIWQIQSDIPKDQDLDLDNRYASYLNRFDTEAAIISPPRGEMMLDDSVFHLKSSLEVSGVRVQRLDDWKDTPDVENTDLMISEVFPQLPLERFCPLEFLRKKTGKNKQVWLVPSIELRDYGTICYCFASLINSSEKLRQRPRFCEDIETREQWIGVMQSLGAKQVGGGISDTLGALAMVFKNEAQNVRIFGFTVALQPIPDKGLSFAQLPLIIRSLLQLFPLKMKNEEGREWPRIEDTMSSESREINQMSNVPFAESKLKIVMPEELPPHLLMIDKHALRSQGPSNLEKNADGWVRASLYILLVSILIEIIGTVVKFIFKSRFSREKMLVFTFFVLLNLPDNLVAQVHLSTLGFNNLSKLGLVKREVSGRTSIELDDQIQNHMVFQKKILDEPWIWVSSPEKLMNLSDSEWTDLLSWIKRGGFLVVERAAEAGVFKGNIQSGIPLGKWKPIPPDHELMRSFHLLASLPQCGTNVWEGFHFDERVAIFLVPGEFLNYLIGSQPTCY